VCPGVVRKAAKLVPTVLQALALVVFIHVVGQVQQPAPHCSVQYTVHCTEQDTISLCFTLLHNTVAPHCTHVNLYLGR
jgi:hypothetical protein